MNELWPHQQAGVDGVLDAIARRVSPIALTSPTGGGKTRIMAELIYRYVTQGKRAVLYSNRKLLIAQLYKSLKELGLDPGVRAAGRKKEGDKLFQIASIQTEDARSIKAPRKLKALNALYEANQIDADEYLRQKFSLEGRATELFDADLALFDEGHLMTTGASRAIMDRHVLDEAAVVLITATPIDMGFCQELVIAGRTSDCRGAGAIVWCTHHGCSEPDFKALKMKPDAEVSEAQAVKAIMTEGIFGNVLQHFNDLNAGRTPTLLFAPGVKESIWFAEQFEAAGIKAAHIDGDHIWLAGEMVASTEESREEVFGRHRRGEIVVVCNRFVLREGIDLPYARHGILATVFGSLKTYLQAAGRLGRADRDPETIARYGPKEFATLQDHGGHWWRLGSVNSNWPWQLDLPPQAYIGVRQERIRAGKEREPQLCPKCSMVMVCGLCKDCGIPVKRGRKVLQSNGKLVEHDEPLFAPRRVKMTVNTQALWDRCYWAAKKGKSGMTFAQALGWFVSKHYYWPPRGIKNMPIDDRDYWRRVRDVPPEKLHQ